ncbi:MAG: FKBP-type peptidyl-prolyl cis-trans isomerase [Gammaproteobacteria bacterium]|jgi:FKBP-type peptidyl-prolyl cis-trans isomerase FklB|nr:FKBP-type peptidyl-prolyl cis-trans isomerase [Gammaproteobacteria bacterium]
MSEEFTTIDEKASYGIGRQVGEQLASQPFDGMSPKAVIAGIADVLEGNPTRVSENEIKAAIDDLNKRLMKQQNQAAGMQAEEGEQFLKDNSDRDEITVTGSGLQYEIITAGDGESPTADSTVKVHYHGTLIDGTVFDSSVNRGEPIEFNVGGVIPGWTEALQLMKVGDKWKLYIPYQLAYGANGAGGVIGPYQALIFEVELLGIS